MTEDYTSSLTRRAKAALKLGAVVLFASTLAYYIAGCICGMNAGYGKSFWKLSDDRWELSECLYFSSITLTTTGYGDLLGTERCELWQDKNGRFRWVSTTDAHEDPGYDESSGTPYFNFSPYTRSLTTVIGIFGMAFFLFVIAQITAFFVEGGYESMAAHFRRMKQLKSMKDHVIVCGAGGDGSHAIDHILESGVGCAVIESDEDAIKRLQLRHKNVPCLPGDATVELTLAWAGIDRARAVISALPDDGLNLATIITIRQDYPDIPVVSRASEEESAIRLKRAGADDVVYTNRLMGLRLASQLIRPTGVDFLDHVLGHLGGQDIELVGIPLNDADVGRSLDDLGLGATADTQVVAVRHEDGTFSYNPSPSETVCRGDHLLVVGSGKANSDLGSMLRSSVEHDDLLARSRAAEHGDENRPDPCGQTLEDDSGHYIICGANGVSIHIARELGSTGRSCCIVDQDLESIGELKQAFPSVRAFEGDPRSLDVLREVGVERARGLVTTFRSDLDNLVTVVTALQTKPDLRVVSLASDDGSERRLEHTGAVTCQLGQIGGRRLASQLLKPGVTSLLDRMLAESGAVRFEGVVVRAGAPNANRPLGEVDVFGQTGLRILALRRPGEAIFVVAPKPDEQLSVGTILVVAGAARQVDRLANLVGDWE